MRRLLGGLSFVVLAGLALGPGASAAAQAPVAVFVLPPIDAVVRAADPDSIAAYCVTVGAWAPNVVFLAVIERAAVATEPACVTAMVLLLRASCALTAAERRAWHEVPHPTRLVLILCAYPNRWRVLFPPAPRES